ncbi:alpha/beta hydrolase domain-containing protein [Nonomuraea sp. N2-4H]|uniref:alpha/beta hydrolase domain-containing protein n=1 Tax=Nonomuraea sp. N2-4H TaxID=3128898 RepID=UPI003250354A
MSPIGAAARLVLPDPPALDPTPVSFRDDLRVPVPALLTETDVVTLDYLSARRPDGPALRVWEVAAVRHLARWVRDGTPPPFGEVTDAAIAAGFLPADDGDEIRAPAAAAYEAAGRA